MSKPMTAGDLAEIKAGIPASYEEPWSVASDHDDDGNLVWLVLYDLQNPDAGLIATVPDYGEELAEFIADANQDVRALVAEVERLREVLADRDQTIAGLMNDVDELRAELKSGGESRG